MPAWLLPAALGLASGVANIFSAGAQARQQRRNIRAAQTQLYENIVEESELDKLLMANERAFNTSIASTLNTTAIRSRGIANSPVVAAAAISPVLGQKAQTELGIRQGAEERNAQVRSQMAQLNLAQPEEDPLGAFVGGAIPGITAGIELGKFLDRPETSSPPGDGDVPPQGPRAGRAVPSLAPDMPSIFDVSNKPGLAKVSPTYTGMNLKADNPYYSDYLGFDQQALNMKLNPFFP